jgi:hypothetical protein
VLDILVQRRRDKQAAKKFFRKLLKGLTYVPQTRTNPPASGGDAYRDSSRQGTRSGFSPPMGRLRHTFARDGIGFLPPTTVKRCGNDSIPGRTSRPSPPPPKNQGRR